MKYWGNGTARWALWIALAACLSCATGEGEGGFSAKGRVLADLALKDVTVVDAVSGVRANQRVVVQGDRIIFVGSMGQPAPRAQREIDARGRYVIPGLWDAHVHFLYDLELTSVMAGQFLRYGVTSVRDTGGNAERLATLRRGWSEADVRVPRLFFSGPLLDGARVVYDGASALQPELGTAVADERVAREKVAALAELGVDFIKIYELVSPATFAALVDEARARGLPVASHVPLSMTAETAGPEVDSMEHLRNVELACAANWRALLDVRRQRMAAYGSGRGYPLRKELHLAQRLPAIAAFDSARCDSVLDALRDTLQVPTVRLNAFNHARPFLEETWQEAVTRLPESVQARWHAKVAQRQSDGSLEDLRFAEWSLFLVGEMRKHEVPIGAGTDTPIGLAAPGESLHRELELLVESGLSNREALAAATVAPARFFSLQGEMGEVATGMRADLVLLRANPLEQIRNTRTIDGVIAAGRWLEF